MKEREAFTAHFFSWFNLTASKDINSTCTFLHSHPAGMGADPMGKAIVHSQNKTIFRLLLAGPSQTCAFPCKSGQHYTAPEAPRNLV